MQVKRKKLIAMLCAAAVMTTSAGGLPLGDFKLLDTVITVSAEDFEGDGSEASPYLINSADDWNALANDVNSGTSYADTYFKLTSDITVTTMIGRNNHGGSGDASAIPKPFSGTFDGDGYVLTLDINSTSTHGAAPFCGVTNATIKNLIVEGKVVGGIHSSGLVGVPSGTLTVENVTVNAEISGQTHLGGMVGHSFAADVSLTDCSFSGKVSGTSYSGGFIGWGGPNGKLTATRCAFTGTYTGSFHPVGFMYQSGTAVVSDFYTTAEANTNSNSFSYSGGLTLNEVTVTAPVAKSELIYDGSEQELIERGSTSSGTMEYSLDRQNYSENIPVAVDAGEYTVWYRVTSGSVCICEKSIDVTISPPPSPAYTVTIPAEVTLGDDVYYNVSVDYPDGVSKQKVRVSIIGDDGCFKVTQGEDALTYTISGRKRLNNIEDDTTSLDVKDNDEILHVDGADDTGNVRYIELKFNEPDQEPKYAGDYTGTVTFNVSLS
ncbi:hypothetical protein [Ruminococcus albus]|uniref:hypothetical protein n=1 Tax=Ruminococcus albus TaxID=1264 RepID=UPI0004672E96|nr:hypothetical protein [Ruminococcus albus]